MDEFPSVMELIVLVFQYIVLLCTNWNIFRNLYKKFGHYLQKFIFMIMFFLIIITIIIKLLMILIIL